MIGIKRILIVTSAYTGAGHQSIADALTEQFSRMPDVEVQVIEGFELMGWKGVQISRIYGFLARHAPLIYDMTWRVTMMHPPGFGLSTQLCLRRFKDCIRNYHPDLILTVHSLLNTLLTRMLQLCNLDIPVVVLQADLIDIHSTWCNPEARMTICPTQEAYDCSIRQGMPPEKLKVMGFPVRSRFCDAARKAEKRTFDGSGPLRCLMMSGAEGSGSLMAYAKAILENTDAKLTVVCGRNKKLRRKLENRLKEKYGDRLITRGFVSAIEKEMMHSDLLITRGSPNTLSEAVVLNLPLIMINPMPEQEKDNPRLMQKYNLGVFCESPAELPRTINSLLSHDAARLRKIRQAQLACRRLDNARKIAAYVAELTEPLDYPV